MRKPNLPRPVPLPRGSRWPPRRRWKDKQSDEWKEETNWSNVVVWQSEKLADFLVKGKQVYVEGRIQTRSYEKDGQKVYATEVVADEVLLLGGQEGHSAAGGNGQARAAAAASGAAKAGLQPRPLWSRSSTAA